MHGHLGRDSDHPARPLATTTTPGELVAASPANQAVWEPISRERPNLARDQPRAAAEPRRADRAGTGTRCDENQRLAWHLRRLLRPLVRSARAATVAIGRSVSHSKYAGPRRAKRDRWAHARRHRWGDDLSAALEGPPVAAGGIGTGLHVSCSVVCSPRDWNRARQSAPRATGSDSSAGGSAGQATGGRDGRVARGPNIQDD